MKLGIWILIATAGLRTSAAVAPLEKVPLVRQSTEYSCGAAALQSVLAFYGVSQNETTVMSGAGTEPDSGTSPEGIADYARSQGLASELRHGVTLDQVEASLREGHPVIADIQAWSEEAEKGRAYKDIWDSGHYVVVIGIDAQNVYLMDPVLLGSRGIVARADFLERWHDVAEGGSQHTAVFFKGTPRPPQAWEGVP